MDQQPPHSPTGITLPYILLQSFSPYEPVSVTSDDQLITFTGNKHPGITDTCCRQLRGI